MWERDINNLNRDNNKIEENFDKEINSIKNVNSIIYLVINV